MQEEDKTAEERRVNKNHDEFYEKKFRERPLYVAPGEFECTIDPNVILAGKVGSGVIICINDPEVKVGGMVHLLMPEQLVENFPHFDPDDPVYAAIDDLTGRFINALKRHGAGKNRIRIKLYGGTAIEDSVDIGLKNYIFAKEQIVQKGLKIASEDIGGKNCRRVFFLPRRGKIHCFAMRRHYDKEELRNMEQTYMDRITQQYAS